MPDLLKMRGISKSYPGVNALRNVDLRLDAGEVLALMGENGAGKSTLIKILSGAVCLDSGNIEIEGREVRFSCPQDSQRAGIGVIHQELNLIPALTAQENIFLGNERSQFGWIRRREELRVANELLRRVGANFDASMPCKHMSVAQLQAVEIAKALSRRARILVMDEPTSALTPQEAEKLMSIVQEVRQQGIGIIYISHRLDEVMRLADRVTVLRDGEHVSTVPAENLSRSALIEMMVGRKLESEFPKRSAQIGGPRLVVSKLNCGTSVRDISFAIGRGEILALTGLVGAGRTETARAIFGADRPESGWIEVDGQRPSIRSPRDAIAARICMLPEDRKQHGLVLGLSVQDNFGLPNLHSLSAYGWIRQGKLRQNLWEIVRQLRIKLNSDQQLAKNLSGGNQQKVVLAKWLMSNAEVIIFDEPTRGIDVGAKYEIYLLMHQLASAGKAILMISSELPEVLGMADRILVMHHGRISGEIRDVAAASASQVLQLAVG